MSTAALTIRDAITARLKAAPAFADMTFQNQPLPQLQPDDLPAVLVVIMGERLSPDGDANHGPPRFEAQITIGISLVEGFDTPVEMDTDVDAKITLIEALLLCDPTFVRGIDHTKPKNDPTRYPYFEAIERIERRRLFPQDGEAYFSEVRLEMTFIARAEYDPTITDRFTTILMHGKPARSSASTPTVNVLISEAQ